LGVIGGFPPIVGFIRGRCPLIVHPHPNPLPSREREKEFREKKKESATLREVFSPSVGLCSLCLLFFKGGYKGDLSPL